MGMRCSTFGFWLRIYLCLTSVWGIQECWSLNDEGLALLEFRERITSDPYFALANWNPNDCDPCKWSGVHCVDGKVQMLNLKGLSLEGTLAPELGKLSHLKSLVLRKNNFYGAIPGELGALAKLELLDLRENNLSGSIPEEIVSVWKSKLKQWSKPGSSVTPMKVTLAKYLSALVLPLVKLGKTTLHGNEENCCDFLSGSNEPETAQSVPNFANSARRKLLDQSSNLAAVPYSGDPKVGISTAPVTMSSGGFPAVPDAKNKQNQSPPPLQPPSDSPNAASSNGNKPSPQHSSNGASWKWWKYIIIIAIVIVLVVFFIVIFCIWRKKEVKVIKPWRTGISGQLQKAFITGVPKLDRGELEAACEDFSNIISTNYNECTIYKGTLSSGVEIGVVSTLITSSQDWSKRGEMNYRKKIDSLCRINHKNFVNLIGFCEEEEPFTRMMVFEYCPNGNLFENLHVREMERLNWSERMRIIMGTAYCLQYMHHDLNPPIAHCNLNSTLILLTDDYAAKIAETTFSGIVLPAKATTGESSKESVLPPKADCETNVYDFGILLLEIISGKLPYSEEQGHLVNWAAEYLNDKRSIGYMIDPTLQSFKDNELDVIYEVIQDCIRPDPRSRPTMRDIASRLREVLGISPEQAVPRLSPLWWAELEILSVEAT